jgi:glutamate-ammonia-ligase adenylyltransferase
LLQLRHGGQVPGLRTPRTLQALSAAREAELLSATDAARLSEAWRMASRVRNAVVLARGKAADQFPRDRQDRRAVAQILGYAGTNTDEMVNDYLKVARRSREVVDRVFWGRSGS